jgi:hypothetical protein
MKLNNILNILPKEPEAFEKESSRRNILKSFGAKVAIAAVPFALGSMFKKAYGQTNDDLHDILNVLLKVKYVDKAFYNKALNTVAAVIPAAKTAFETIIVQEDNHINSLIWLIQNTGGTAVASPLIDPTGGKGSGSGPFSIAFSDGKQLFELAQALEDFTVEAFKGQMVKLIGNDLMLSIVASINTVDGKHAAHIRNLRYNTGSSTVRPWITGNSSESENSYTIPFYQPEAQIVQSGITIPGINGTGVTVDAATQAFDETHEKERVLQLIDPFIIP